MQDLAHHLSSFIIYSQWTVNGLLRIGFFTLRAIPTGTELTFDYQLQRYGSVVSHFCSRAVSTKDASHSLPPPPPQCSISNIQTIWPMTGMDYCWIVLFKNFLTFCSIFLLWQILHRSKVAQPCYCESVNCRGIIGGEKLTPLKNTVERIGEQ